MTTQPETTEAILAEMTAKSPSGCRRRSAEVYEFGERLSAARQREREAGPVAWLNEARNGVTLDAAIVDYCVRHGDKVFPLYEHPAAPHPVGAVGKVQGDTEDYWRKRCQSAEGELMMTDRWEYYSQRWNGPTPEKGS